MMMVVGEEGTSVEDFVIYLKSEFLDAVFLQQNAFDQVDAATSPERQKYMAEKIHSILKTDFPFKDKEAARKFFYSLRQNFIDWNYIEFESDQFKKHEKTISKLIGGVSSSEADSDVTADDPEQKDENQADKSEDDQKTKETPEETPRDV